MNEDEPNLVALKARVEKAHTLYVHAKDEADIAADRSRAAREEMRQAQHDFERAISKVRGSNEPWVA